MAGELAYPKKPPLTWQYKLRNLMIKDDLKYSILRVELNAYRRMNILSFSQQNGCLKYNNNSMTYVLRSVIVEVTSS